MKLSHSQVQASRSTVKTGSEQRYVSTGQLTNDQYTGLKHFGSTKTYGISFSLLYLSDFLLTHDRCLGLLKCIDFIDSSLFQTFGLSYSTQHSLLYSCYVYTRYIARRLRVCYCPCSANVLRLLYVISLLGVCTNSYARVKVVYTDLLHFMYSLHV